MPDKIKLFIIVARPSHWLKNLFVFIPIFFSGNLIDLEKFLSSMYVFLIFCTISSAIYIINDIFDINADKLHPVKKFRPLAAGQINKKEAFIVSLTLTICSLAISTFISLNIFLLTLSYFVLHVAYSIKLKHIVVVDIHCVAIGFVIRVLAGGIASSVDVSAWLIVMTFLLALFLSLAKRINELMISMDETHRVVLGAYSEKLLNTLITVTTPIILLAYLIYTLSPEVNLRFQTNYLYITSIFVIFGLFRYLYLVHIKNQGGSPVTLFYRDIPLLLSVIFWIVFYIFIIYL